MVILLLVGPEDTSIPMSDLQAPHWGVALFVDECNRTLGANAIGIVDNPFVTALGASRHRIHRTFHICTFGASGILGIFIMTSWVVWSQQITHKYERSFSPPNVLVLGVVAFSHGLLTS